MLAYYLQQTSRLLQNPGAPTSLYSTADLTSYINTMRGQLAARSGCCRRNGTISTVIGQREYAFSGIALTDATVSGTLNVRRIQYAVGSGFKWMAPRSWPWFEFYYLNNPVPPSGAPKRWAQYGQGASGGGALPNAGAGTVSSGTFWIDPLPDLVYALTMDCTCYPAALAVDGDPEAIPYQWTDAVPYGAAWMALVASQTSARMADAERYFGYFDRYVQAARDGSTPPVLRYEYEQVPDPTALNQMALPQAKGQQQ